MARTSNTVIKQGLFAPLALVVKKLPANAGDIRDVVGSLGWKRA